MGHKLAALLKNKTIEWATIIAGTLILLVALFNLLYEPLFQSYTGLENGPLTYENSKKVSDTEFEAIVREITYQEREQKARELTRDETDPFTRKIRMNMLMNTPSFMNNTPYMHIKYFRYAGIRQI
ncbi:MAG: hypothetical protein J7L94_11175 [Caldisericaceae bacterium]|nr:hypothetical protein [Caldisericaceae bacterium]